MPIYEYYCPDNHRIYQFYAKTLAQGKTTPKCPDNPKFRMEKVVSRFAVKTGGKKDGSEGAGDSMGAGGAGDSPEDTRMEAAMDAMEREFSNVDENDPRAMGRMMRRMSELSGEKIEGEMEEVVRKLEEGADPDSLEEQFGEGEGGGGADPHGDEGGLPGGSSGGASGAKESRGRERSRSRARAEVRPRAAPTRDPKLYDYE